jgi:hypothetical protein
MLLGSWRLGQPPIQKNRAQSDEIDPRRSILEILSLPGAQDETRLRTQETDPPWAMARNFAHGVIEKSKLPPRFRLLTVDPEAPIVGALGAFDCPPNG